MCLNVEVLKNHKCTIWNKWKLMIIDVFFPKICESVGLVNNVKKRI